MPFSPSRLLHSFQMQQISHSLTAETFFKIIFKEPVKGLDQNNVMPLKKCTCFMSKVKLKVKLMY